MSFHWKYLTFPFLSILLLLQCTKSKNEFTYPAVYAVDHDEVDAHGYLEYQAGQFVPYVPTESARAVHNQTISELSASFRNADDSGKVTLLDPSTLEWYSNIPGGGERTAILPYRIEKDLLILDRTSQNQPAPNPSYLHVKDPQTLIARAVYLYTGTRQLDFLAYQKYHTPEEYIGSYLEAHPQYRQDGQQFFCFFADIVLTRRQ